MFWSRILPGVVILFVSMIGFLLVRRWRMADEEDEYWTKRKTELDKWERGLRKPAPSWKSYKMATD
jgi:hypothetical protein